MQLVELYKEYNENVVKKHSDAVRGGIAVLLLVFNNRPKWKQEG